MRFPTLVLTMLVFATAAGAQEGPAPGYATALAYAGDHVEEQVANASSDPVAYGQGKARAGQVGEDARHAAWLACWAAHDAGVVPPAGTCDLFFEAPSEVEPPGQEDPAVPEQVNATLAEANATAQEAVDTLQETQESLPGGLDLGVVWDALREALAAVTEGVGGAVVRLGGTLEAWQDRSVALLQGSVQTGLDGMRLSAAGYASLGAAVLDAAQASWDGVQTAGVATQEGASATGGAIGDAAAALGRSLQKAALATGDGIQAAARASGEAFQDAAAAVGGAVADGWDAVADAVAGLFGSSRDAPGAVDGGDQDLLGETVDSEGLLDGVAEAVPLL